VIHVEPRPEPDDFDSNVREPGRRELARLVESYGSVEEIPGAALKPLWRRCLPQLHTAYGGVCAYVCHWIPRVTGSRTTDHYVPKSASPARAYEWDNYRLACSRMNARKHAAQDVLDPFEVQDGWFWIEFYGFQVRPARGLDPQLRARVVETIRRLKLNGYDCRRDREDYVSDYRARRISYAQLQRKAPFIARELARQGRLLES
jgi:hypothetical protein